MKLKYIMFLMLVAGVFAACSGKKETSDDHEHSHDTAKEEWKEMDDFHMLMAEAFHPYKDSSNLEPAKTKAPELASAAEKWASASLPEKVDNDEIKNKLQELKTGTAAFAETVKGVDDKVIGEELTKLHDQFHAIQEAWYGGHGEHHH